MTNLLNIFNTVQKRLAVIALVLAALALINGNSTNNNNYSEWDFGKIDIEDNEVNVLSVYELSKWIMEKRNDFLLIDSRTKVQFNEYHIPFAEIYDKANNNTSIDSKHKIIIYTQDESFPKELWLSINLLNSNIVYVLQGGMNEWINEILFPNLIEKKLTNKDLIKKITATSLYFGGKPKLPASYKPKTNKRLLREGC